MSLESNILPTLNWLMKLSTATGQGLDLDQKGRRCRPRLNSPRGAGTPYTRSVPRYWSATSDQTEDGEDLDASRPQFSFTCLIGLAVLSSAEKKLSVGHIYDYISRNFPYYKSAKGTWRNSVRHVLSLNKFFQKPPVLPGQAAPPAKGGVWEIKPLMIAVLVEHIAEGQQRLPAATCRHLGLPQLKKRVVKSRIGRGRSSWSGCTTQPNPTKTLSKRSAAKAAAAASPSPLLASATMLPPPPPPAASSAWGAEPLGFDLDLDELDTLASLRAELDSDEFEPPSPASVCSTSSSSVFAESMDSVGSSMSIHSAHSAATHEHAHHVVPDLGGSDWIGTLAHDDMILESVFGQLDSLGTRSSSASCHQQYLPALSLGFSAE